MSSIGERLRQERLRRGLSIEQVAENTRISARYLEAIESGDLERIPGKFFARSFLRQYANAVGLDEGELSAELDRLTEPEPLPTIEDIEQQQARRIDVEPMPAAARSGMSQRTWMSLGAFVLMVVACSLIYVLWQRARQTPAPQPATEQQQASRTPATQQQPAAQPESAAQPPADQPAAAPATEGQPPAPAAGTEQQPATAAGANPAPAETKPVAPAEASGSVRLQVTASEPAWIRVTVDGKIVMADTLPAGTTKAFGGNEAIRVRAGNAGALEITYNGHAVGPIGPKGQIRTLEFTPTEFHAVTPPPKPATPPPAEAPAEPAPSNPPVAADPQQQE